MSCVTAGNSSIKVSAVRLCLSCFPPVYAVITADSTTGYSVIYGLPPVLSCCMEEAYSRPISDETPLFF